MANMMPSFNTLTANVSETFPVSLWHGNSSFKTGIPNISIDMVASYHGLDAERCKVLHVATVTEFALEQRSH